MRVHTNVNEVLVTDIKHSKSTVSRAECSLVRHGFSHSECLAEKNNNPLGALSCIESVDSKSHEIKR